VFYTWRVEGDTVVIRQSCPWTLRSLVDWVASGQPWSESYRFEIRSLDAEKGSPVCLVAGPDLMDTQVTLTRVEPTPGTNPTPPP
jgi:hypothetical protein